MEAEPPVALVRLLEGEERPRARAGGRVEVAVAAERRQRRHHARADLPVHPDDAHAPARGHRAEHERVPPGVERRRLGDAVVDVLAAFAVLAHGAEPVVLRTDLVIPDIHVEPVRVRARRVPGLPARRARDGAVLLAHVAEAERRAVAEGPVLRAARDERRRPLHDLLQIRARKAPPLVRGGLTVQRVVLVPEADLRVEGRERGARGRARGAVARGHVVARGDRRRGGALRHVGRAEPRGHVARRVGTARALRARRDARARSRAHEPGRAGPLRIAGRQAGARADAEHEALRALAARARRAGRGPAAAAREADHPGAVAARRVRRARVSERGRGRGHGRAVGAWGARAPHEREDEHERKSRLTGPHARTG